MTATQALVALALFAPGVLAPKLGLSVRDVSLFAIAVFAVGMATSYQGGRLADRFGSCKVASACAIFVALGMISASSAVPAAHILAGILVGLAFGPETPASSTLLGRLAQPAQRPLIFSVRQTGNQIGAMIGSFALPLIALMMSPRAGYLIIAAIAATGAIFLLMLSPHYDLWSRNEAASRGARPKLQDLDSVLVALAIASVPFSGMQLALNAFLVTHAVVSLGLDHVSAGALLGTAQLGGFVGRLAWGQIAARWCGSLAVIVFIGFAMGILAVTMGALGPATPSLLLFAIAFFFGLTASGWNGVFLAEIARRSPEGRVAETTGAVLTASYGGLLVTPFVISLLSPTGSLAASYTVLAVAALAATANLIWSRRADAKRI
jgi:MFS family permease